MIVQPLCSSSRRWNAGQKRTYGEACGVDACISVSAKQSRRKQFDATEFSYQLFNKLSSLLSAKAVHSKISLADLYLLATKKYRLQERRANQEHKRT